MQRAIGEKVVLWLTEYSNAAYVDQFGIWHEGQLVKEVVAITITDVKEVPCCWTGEHKGYFGYKGIDDSGREYEQNFTSYPSDSSTPEYYWYRWDDPDRTDASCLESAPQASQRSHIVFVMPDGSRASA